VAAGSGDVVVIARVTGKLKDAFVELFPLSVTVTVKLAFTADCTGVPCSMPPAVRFSHVGSPVADQV
jgi:hypothetical protein